MKKKIVYVTYVAFVGNASFVFMCVLVLYYNLYHQEIKLIYDHFSWSNADQPKMLITHLIRDIPDSREMLVGGAINCCPPQKKKLSDDF